MGWKIADCSRNLSWVVMEEDEGEVDEAHIAIFSEAN